MSEPMIMITSPEEAPRAAPKRPVVTQVHIDQFSGLWTRKPKAVRRQAARSAADGKRSILLLTEMANDGRARAALRGVETANGEPWHMIRDTDGDKGEVAILVRDREWEIVRSRVYVVGPRLGDFGGRTIVAIALLRHRITGATLVVSVSHLPSAVEGDWDGERAQGHRRAVRRWRRIHRAWRRAFKPDAEIAWADWNLDLHKKWVQDWVDEAWPALDVPRRSVIPKRGTHRGGRLIDWFVKRNLRVVSWRILRWPWASDHSGNRLHAQIVTPRR